MVDLDPRMNDERLEPKEETTSIILGEDEKQCTYIGGSMPEELLSKLIVVLRRNKDLFAWKAADIPGIDPDVISHKYLSRSKAGGTKAKKARGRKTKGSN